MKYLKLVILSFIFTSSLNAKDKSDVIYFHLIQDGGNHTISTFIGSNINDVYSVIYRFGNHSGDEFGMPIYILSPKLIKFIEVYIQSQGFFYPVRDINDTLFYYVGFRTKDPYGLNQYFYYGIGGLSFSKSYFQRMLWWINLFSFEKDSLELKEFLQFIQQDLVDFKGMIYSPLQHERYMERRTFEEKLQQNRWFYYSN